MNASDKTSLPDAPPQPRSRDLKDVRVPKVPSVFSAATRRPAAPGRFPGTTHRPSPVSEQTRYRFSEAAPAPLVALVPELPSTSVQLRARLAGWLGRQQTMVALGMLAAVALLGWHDGASWLAAVRSWQWHSPAESPNRFLRTAPDWYRQARQRAAAGDFRLALGAVRYALALLPGDSVLLEFEGDMHQSLFEFQIAQDCYEQALEANPRSLHARQNLALCRRLNRYHDDPASHRSTLYGLHRVMLGQQRMPEAVAISRRLIGDHALQQATWQAALDHTGLHGKIILDAHGGLDLDLSTGPLQPDLSLIRDFPITGLNVAGTGLEDLHVLRGLPLETLNLSGTVVHDLAPLRGMPLRELNLHGTGVVDLSALTDCPLHDLDISNTRIWNLYPLANTALTSLRASDTPVSDLRPLAALPLTRLELSRSWVADLTPLGSLGLQVLALDGTGVADLTPLQSSPLRELDLAGTSVSNLAPLAGMPLGTLSLAHCPRALDLRPLLSCPELEHLSVPAYPLNLKLVSKLPRLRFIVEDPAAAAKKPSLRPAAEALTELLAG